MVSTTSYDALIASDWLHASGANINYRESLLTYELEPGRSESVPIQFLKKGAHRCETTSLEECSSSGDSSNDEFMLNLEDGSPRGWIGVGKQYSKKKALQIAANQKADELCDCDAKNAEEREWIHADDGARSSASSDTILGNDGNSFDVQIRAMSSQMTTAMRMHVNRYTI